MKQTMKALQASSQLGGCNAPYVEELYESYLSDPNGIDEHWRHFFESLPMVDGVTIDAAHSKIRQYFFDLAQQGPTLATGTPSATPGSFEHEKKQIKVLQLINAYRFRGHQHANLDPLGLIEKEIIPELTLQHHDLSSADLDTEFSTGSFATSEDSMKLKDLLAALKSTYCGAIGAEYMHITETTEKRWLQDRLERTQSKPNFSSDTQQYLLRQITAAEGLEKYLHTKYVGQKRFSVEGAETVIPLINELIQRSGAQGAKEMVIGMAHRGRLNVLINTLGKSPSLLFAEFEGKHDHHEALKLGSGDVKYHMGFSSDINTPGGHVHVALAFNPSHLEIVSPVVVGSVRARQQRRHDRDKSSVVPVIIHGDAAFAGQGVVMETFNMSQARGFSVGGTIHVVINNQIGFTTSNPLDARSTLYCTDVAKMVQAPILHVNGDDPEAVLFTTQVALDYRNTFLKDVVIDLVCYRRHGHNEADEPSATQPLMYQKIKKLPTTRSLYAKSLINKGVISEQDAKQMVAAYRFKLENGENVVSELVEKTTHPYAEDWHPYLGHEWTEEEAKTDTSISMDTHRHIAKQLAELPEGFELHPRVKKIYADRQKMSGGALAIDWGYGEIMAYASLVNDGYAVRLVGQDCGRGTFFHRHAVLHNLKQPEAYIPLQNIAEDQPQFLVIDSLLSEEAVLAFEYGYATTDPKTLVIWEAQFGDFANGAQVVIDQFISSGEQKWGRLSGLVMLLPHGYEGQGPEHSSARLERYLQLCAQHNMQVCVPTTPGQVFHMLRRQMLMRTRKPLIVMTPKSLLRHKLAVSALEDLTKGHFHTVIPEIDDPENGGPDNGIVPKDVDRIILCSGKVYYELLEERRAKNINNVAIMRIEQLYPFPEHDLRVELSRYAHVKQVIWCQEEPMNQGAWYCSQHHINNSILDNQHLHYVGRPSSASPAVGYFGLHVEQQKALIEEALVG